MKFSTTVLYLRFGPISNYHGKNSSALPINVYDVLKKNNNKIG